MYRNKDVSSDSTARRALFQGPDHQVQIQPVNKTTIGALPVNKYLQEDTLIYASDDVPAAANPPEKT